MHNHNDKVSVNFKKARTHLEKIITMLENSEYCIDIMQQNLAVMGLLKSAQQMLMEGHLNSCFKNAMKTNNGKKQEEMVKEILAVSRFSNK